MAWHKMCLNDQEHRTLKLNTELSSDENFSVTIIYEKDSSGTYTNFLVVKCLGPKKLFEDIIIPSDELKVPPDVDSLRKDECEEEEHAKQQ